MVALLSFTLFQATIHMNDEVNVTNFDVTGTTDCLNGDGIVHLDFYSPGGIVRLGIFSIPLTKLSYSVESSATGTGTSTFY